MFYNGILEKKEILNSGFRVRVDLGDGNTAFFWFRTDPSENDVIAEVNAYIARVSAPKPLTKSIELRRAENDYIDFCRSLGLPDVASITNFMSLIDAASTTTNKITAIKYAFRVLFLLNQVIQYGGQLSKIEYHVI